MINERKLSKSELEKREDIIMKMKGNKRDLVKKYGKDAEAVMYGRATNMAKKKTENMRNSKLTELIKDALKNPKKADLDKDGKLSSYEKTRGKAIEKSMASEDLESGQYGDPKVGNYDITSQNDNEAGDIEALSAAGLEEGTDNEMELKGQEMVDYIMKTWDWSEEKTLKFLADKFGNLNEDIADLNPKKALIRLKDAAKEKGKDIKAFIKTADGLDILTTLFPGFAAAGGLMEDIDIGHEDNEPGMLQGDLYQIGKSAMEIYQLLDDMEGEGEVDLPSWWQAKIFKAKEAIVGAAEYLDFELKEPAVDAVVDTVEPLDIEVDPLGETVEDYITSVDDLTEKKDMDKSKVAEKIFNKLKEGLPKGFWDKKIDAKDEDQDGKVDEIGGYDRKGNKEMDSDEKGMKKRPQAGMSALLKKDDIDESYDSLVKKIKKSGKSEKAAKAIAGAVASYKAKGGGKGPTAKQK